MLALFKRQRRLCTALSLIIVVIIFNMLRSTTAVAFQYSSYDTTPVFRIIVATHKNVPWQRCSRRSVPFCSKNDEDDDDDDETWLETMDVDSVSDEDALLAVRAYLVRKKRLQWKAAEERKQRRQKYQASMADASSLRQPITGFFWEDPNQLPYLTTSSNRGSNRRRRKRLLAASTGTNSSLSNDDDDDLLDVVTMPATSTTNQLLVDENHDDEEEGDDDEDAAATALWESGQNPEETLDEWETIVNTPEMLEQVRQLVDDDDNDDDTEGIPDEEDDEFSAIDGTPSPSFLRRSTAAKRRWSDPVWKAQWYEKRWGSSSNNNNKQKQASASKQQRRKQYRPLTFDAEAFLASPELAQLSPDEIAQAIESYMRSKERRRKSRQKTRLQRHAQIMWNSSSVLSSSNDREGKDAQEETIATIDRDSLFQPNPDELLAKQKQRSERAKRAYQTRLEKQQVGNMKQKMTHQKPKRRQRTTTTTSAASSRTTTTTSPYTALRQIQAALNDNQFPSRSDVECILLPPRLAQRKQVLLRILNECFDLRGKCVPVRFLGVDANNDDVDNDNDANMKNVDGDEEEYAFVTHCPVHVIGYFVLHKLKQLEEE